MAVKTRIGVAHLVREHIGSIDLPEEVTLYCPQCNIECADKGQCLLALEIFPNTEIKNDEVKLVVDCRTCGCMGKAPVTFPK